MLRVAVRPLVLLVAFGLILVGSVLALLGSVMSGSAGGCFFWPLPVIIVCGVGSAASSYLFVIAGAVATVLVLLLSLFWIRKASGNSTSD